MADLTVCVGNIPFANPVVRLQHVWFRTRDAEFSEPWPNREFVPKV